MHLCIVLQAYTDAVQQQKDAFLLIFQNFNDVFLDHISRCEHESAPVEDEWFRISLGRFKTLGQLLYH